MGDAEGSIAMLDFSVNMAQVRELLFPSDDPSEEISALSCGVNYNDLTATEPWNHGLFRGNHPQMAARFRLVKHCNLPRM